MRKRFNRAERETLMVGAEVEWRNGRHWHPGVITGPIRNCEYGSGFQSVNVRNTARTGGVPYGETLAVSPTHVRAR